MLDQARDAATQQTAAGYPLVKTIDTSFSFTREEVSVLRALAWQVAEIFCRGCGSHPCAVAVLS